MKRASPAPRPAWRTPLLLLLPFLALHAAAPSRAVAQEAAPPLWKFMPDEKWQAEWLDKTSPAPFTLGPDARGLAVAFGQTAAEAVCPLRALRWREIIPLGIRPTRLSLEVAMTAGAGVSVAPQVLDANGNAYQLAARPVTGQPLAWDLSADLRGKVVKNGVEAVPPGTALAGPVYLDELRVAKAAGPPRVAVSRRAQRHGRFPADAG